MAQTSVSLAEAQRRSGISRYLLVAAAENGGLEAERMGNRWRVNLESLDALALTIGAETLTIAQAEREYGISRKALRAAIADGRLEAWNARQHHDRPGRDGDRWRFTREALERFIASCPPCPWPGCDRPGVTAAGRCSQEHSGTLPGTRRSPETRARISAAKMGQGKGVPKPHTPEWDANIGEGRRAFLADPERSAPYRRAKSEEMRRAFAIGEGAARAMVLTKGPRTRQKMFGRWDGRKGGRPRGYTELQKKGVLKLKREHPELGRVGLARESGLTEKQVRAILDAEASEG
jgi:hypothetical protein